MKKPENFNTGATVKKTDLLADAINNNFSTTKTTTQTAPATESKTEEHPSQDQLPLEKEKKEKFLVSMAKGERANFKAFCAIKNISMNHFVMCAMDYFKEDIEAGKVTISQHSYKRQLEDK